MYSRHSVIVQLTRRGMCMGLSRLHYPLCRQRSCRIPEEDIRDAKKIDGIFPKDLLQEFDNKKETRRKKSNSFTFNCFKTPT
mmetsp:Transcript_33517/g.33759  ORF Transcript_33517/g.33759 Transcript_33517/m.33759 type:complete len:82 (+) Transcript_33517:1153-1398(+)